MIQNPKARLNKFSLVAHPDFGQVAALQTLAMAPPCLRFAPCNPSRNRALAIAGLVQRSPKTIGGFSLVEAMVALAIGLLTVLIVSQVLQVSDARKRASTSGSHALVNATLGMYTIERDAKNAGYGLTTVRSSIGCNVKKKFGSNDMEELILAPVKIADGAGGAPDAIQFLASSKSGVTLPTRIAADHSATAENIFVESDVGIEIDDLMIAVPLVTSGSWCSVFQVTPNAATAAINQVSHSSGQSSWNQPASSTIFPGAGYSAGDYVINLGNFLDHTYSIKTQSSKSYLQLQDYAMSTNITSDLLLYPHVVQLQAVYGKDTSIPSDKVVDAWNATAPTTAAEWQQIIAVRIALVARGDAMESEVITLDGEAGKSSCNSTKPHPAAICWKPNPNGNGVKIDVSADNPNWQRYRYIVRETTIPLRNAIWQE